MNIIIRNKRATFEYSILDTYIAGIQLMGTEVKSLKLLKASISEAFCAFQNEELYIKNMHISEYANIKHTNHAPLRDRKLLLNKSEIAKILKSVKEKGLTIIPINILVSDTGYIKVEIAIAKGKKVYDKRLAERIKTLKNEIKSMET